MSKFVINNDKLELAIQRLTNVANTYESDDDEVIIVCVNEDKVIDDITECINCIYDRKAHSECYDMLHKYKRLIVASIINDRIRTEVVCPVCGVLYTTFVEAQHYKSKDAWRVGDRLVIACFSCESDRKAHKRTTTLFGKPCEYKYVKDASQSDDKGE